MATKLRYSADVLEPVHFGRDHQHPRPPTRSRVSRRTAWPASRPCHHEDLQQRCEIPGRVVDVANRKMAVAVDEVAHKRAGTVSETGDEEQRHRPDGDQHGGRRRQQVGAGPLQRRDEAHQQHTDIDASRQTTTRSRAGSARAAGAADHARTPSSRVAPSDCRRAHRRPHRAVLGGVLRLWSEKKTDLRHDAHGASAFVASSHDIVA